MDEITNLILQTGYSKPLTRIVCADKEELQSVLIDFHLLVKVKLSMDQFSDGLRAVGIIVSTDPEMWRRLFVATDRKITAGRAIIIYNYIAIESH